MMAEMALTGKKRRTKGIDQNEKPGKPDFQLRCNKIGCKCKECLKTMKKGIANAKKAEDVSYSQNVVKRTKQPTVSLKESGVLIEEPCRFWTISSN